MNMTYAADTALRNCQSINQSTLFPLYREFGRASNLKLMVYWEYGVTELTYSPCSQSDNCYICINSSPVEMIILNYLGECIVLHQWLPAVVH